MIISHRHRFIYVKTYKTASTSVQVFLSGHCGNDDVVTPIHPPVEPHHAQNYVGYFNPIPELLEHPLDGKKAVLDFYSKTKFSTHMAAWRIRARIPSRVWNSYFKFCIERNPWDKVVSYYYASRARLDFAEYIERQNRFGSRCVNYPLYMSLSTQGLLVDRVLRYESLTEELSEVCSFLGIAFTGIEHIKAKSGFRNHSRSYRDYYSRRQKDIIARLHEPEIKLHGYEF